MAKKRNLSDLVVACEWAACTFKGRTMEELCDHMSLHLKEHLGDGDAMEELDDFACLWDGCQFLAMGSPSELVVHAHFHIFHAKLKFIGAQLLQSHPELPSCTQDLHNNNLIPELSERFLCQWEHCDSTFNNPEWFYRHVDMHAHCTEMQPLADQQQALFCSWKGCDAFFKIKYRLREHLRSHTQERLVACPTCGCMFSSNTKFFDHIHRQAEPEGNGPSVPLVQLCLCLKAGTGGEDITLAAMEEMPRTLTQRPVSLYSLFKIGKTGEHAI